MNALTEVQAVSAEVLEHVLGTGDLGKLTTPQRVEYYRKTCESLGLNPLTRPIRFLALNGQIQLYFTRDGTDQLRKANGITLHVVDKTVEAGVYAVTVRARDKHGREDEDVGAVALPAGGESRANALMKAITKAKRRVTLSICGLGQTDESELDTMPGARTFDADEEPPVVPIRTVEHLQVGQQALNQTGLQVGQMKAAAASVRAEKIVDKSTVYDTAPNDERKSWAQWAETLEIIANRDEASSEELGRTIARAEVAEIYRRAQAGDQHPTKDRIIAAYNRIEARYLADPPLPPDDTQDEVHIEGEEKLAAG